MYILGLVIYIGLPVLITQIETANAFLTDAYRLSPEITVLIAIAYAYPLFIFALSTVLRNKPFANKDYFKSQVILASSLAVSFGLIGTFIGLAEMIAGIAAGMGAEGDFSVKMTALLTAIGDALDAMSYAFLTSILGIGASVAILLASNYLQTFFKNKEAVEEETVVGSDGKPFTVSEGIKNIEDSIGQSLDLVESKEKLWNDLYLLLEGNSGSQVAQNLMEVLQNNNQLHQSVVKEIQDLKAEQVQMNNENRQRLEQITQRTQGALDKVVDVLEVMSVSARELKESHTENTSRFIDISGRQMEQLTTVSGMLDDIRLGVAPPLKDSLKDAIKNDDFELLFQPERNSKGAIVGAEAFIKWVDNSRGHINNGDLFEAAKELGLQIELDKWVMRAAVTQLSEWIKKRVWHPTWNLSINLSPEFLIDPKIVTYLDQLLKQHEVEPSQFGIELTEDTIMNHKDASQDKIRQIKSIGVKTYIDDFGTGFMSVVNLKSLDIDRIKVDRSILRGYLDGTEDESVIRSILLMAKELDMEIAAEAIETREDFAKLIQTGCTVFQGYLLGRPSSAEDFIKNFVMTKKPTKA